MAHHYLFQLSCLCLLFTFTLLPLSQCQEDNVTPSSTIKPPPKRYPVRMFIGNMYHRFRSNRTGYLLIPPLLRLAYQYGPTLIRGLGLVGAGNAASQSAVEGLVNSAVNTALGSAGASGQAAAGGVAAGQAGLGVGGLGGPLPAFGGGIPMGFGQPVFFRRR